MLTRRAKRVAVRPELAHAALPPLPLSLLLTILSLLPVDERLLAAFISRAFRAAVSDPSLWRVVNLAPDSGVGRRVNEALLHAVSLKAAGTMVSLDVRERNDVNERPLSWRAIRAAVAANLASLRHLNVHCTEGVCASVVTVVLLLATAHDLRTLEADVWSPAGASADILLSSAGPFAPLRMRKLHATGPWAGEASVLALARAVVSHPSLQYLELDDAPLHSAAALGAVVDVTVGRRLGRLFLAQCSLGPGSVPGLVRVLGDGQLSVLAILNLNQPLLDAVSSPALCAAVRACRLTTLWLCNVGLWGSMAIGDALVSALAGHATIRKLSLGGNGAPGHEPAVGASLARLLLADAPALESLVIGGCALHDAGVRPVAAALRGCTHLACLEVKLNGVTPQFAGDELLPAVAANASLRTLLADSDDASVPELAQAEALVAARPRP